MAEFITVVSHNSDWVYTTKDEELFNKCRFSFQDNQTYFVEINREHDDPFDDPDITKVYATPDGVPNQRRARNMTETIQVEAIGPYGVRVGEEWYKFGKGIDRTQFTRGAQYSVLTNPGPKGGKYINKIVLGTSASAPAALDPGINANTPPENSTEDLKALAAKSGIPMKNGKALSAYEIDQDIRIRRSGVVQAAAQCPVLNQVVTDGSKETLKAAIREIAEDMLAWVNAKREEVKNEAGS